MEKKPNSSYFISPRVYHHLQNNQPEVECAERLPQRQTRKQRHVCLCPKPGQEPHREDGGQRHGRHHRGTAHQRDGGKDKHCCHHHRRHRPPPLLLVIVSIIKTPRLTVRLGTISLDDLDYLLDRQLLFLCAAGIIVLIIFINIVVVVIINITKSSFEH